MVGKPLYCSKSCRPTACNWFHHLSSNSLRTQHFIITRHNLHHHHHHHFHAHITQEHTVSTMWTYVDCRIHAVENQGPTMSPIGLDWNSWFWNVCAPINWLFPDNASACENKLQTHFDWKFIGNGVGGFWLRSKKQSRPRNYIRSTCNQNTQIIFVIAIIGIGDIHPSDLLSLMFKRTFGGPWIETL